MKKNKTGRSMLCVWMVVAGKVKILADQGGKDLR